MTFFYSVDHYQMTNRQCSPVSGQHQGSITIRETLSSKIVIIGCNFRNVFGFGQIWWGGVRCSNCLLGCKKAKLARGWVVAWLVVAVDWTHRSVSPLHCPVMELQIPAKLLQGCCLALARAQHCPANALPSSGNYPPICPQISQTID